MMLRPTSGHAISVFLLPDSGARHQPFGGTANSASAGCTYPPEIGGFFPDLVSAPSQPGGPLRRACLIRSALLPSVHFPDSQISLVERLKGLRERARAAFHLHDHISLVRPCSLDERRRAAPSVEDDCRGCFSVPKRRSRCFPRTTPTRQKEVQGPGLGSIS